nr:hypothetical protein PJ912_06660 [Pectobacterium colocasium]
MDKQVIRAWADVKTAGWRIEWQTEQSVFLWVYQTLQFSAQRLTLRYSQCK